MKGSNVDSQITLLGKAAVTAINSTFEDFPVLKADVTVCDFKMATKLTRGGTSNGTVRALRRVNRSNVSLQKGVGRECERLIGDVLDVSRKRRLLPEVLEAFRTTEPLLSVYSTLMGSEIASSIKGHLTLLSSALIDMIAWERFLVQMNRYDVFLKGGMLPESLVTRRVLGTAVFVSTIMRSNMPTETRSSHETFSTAWAIANVVTDSGMGTLHVMLEMRSA